MDDIPWTTLTSLDDPKIARFCDKTGCEDPKMAAIYLDAFDILEVAIYAFECAHPRVFLRAP